MSQSAETSLCEEKYYSDFFKSQAKSLRNFLIIKFGDETLAEDLVQESFVQIWKNCASVEITKAKSYLFTVAVNKGLSVKRHEKVVFKHQNLVINTSKEGTEVDSPEFKMLEGEFMDKFKKLIASLPDRQREVFLLSRVEGKSYREIAEMCNISVKAVEKLMSKALLKMRTGLGKFKI